MNTCKEYERHLSTIRVNTINLYHELCDVVAQFELDTSRPKKCNEDGVEETDIVYESSLEALADYLITTGAREDAVTQWFGLDSKDGPMIRIFKTSKSGYLPAVNPHRLLALYCDDIVRPVEHTDAEAKQFRSYFHHVCGRIGAKPKAFKKRGSIAKVCSALFLKTECYSQMVELFLEEEWRAKNMVVLNDTTT